MTFSRRSLLAAVVATGALCGPAVSAAGAAPAIALLTTANAPGADDCPDAPALAAIVNEGLGRTGLVTSGTSSAAPARRIAVSFQRAPRGYAATVHIGGARSGTRKLSNDGPGCRALANAVGVLLVLVLDSGDDAAPDVSAPPVSGAGAGAVGPTSGSALTADVGIGGGVAEGLVGGWSPAVGLGGALTYGLLSGRLGGFWLPAKSSDVGPGRVEVGLTAARLALCLTPHRDPRGVGLGLCAQQQAGWLRGRGLDFDDSRTVDRLWLATGAAVVVNGPLGGPVGWEVEAGVVRLWRQDRFTVGGFGTAFQSPPAAFMTTLSFTTRLW